MKIKLIRRMKYYCLRLLRIKNSDHRIAVGFMAGFFHCWFPTFGIGMLLSVGVAKLLRGNLAAAIISGSLGSFMWPVLFFLNYKVGFILSSFFTTPAFQLEEVIDIPIPDFDYSETVDHFSSLGHIGTHFLVGSLVNSVLFSIVGYYVVRYILKYYRQPLLRKLRRS